MSVLLLNASYEPLCVLPTRRAVTLLLEGKAELLESHDDDYVRSASLEVPIPLVVRLNYMVRVPWAGSAPYTKRGVLARDEFTCQFSHCSNKADTIDHVDPRSRGGADRSWTNSVAACYRCNQKKGDKTLKELGWTLKRPPTVPKGALILHVVRNKGSHPAWEPYLSYA